VARTGFRHRDAIVLGECRFLSSSYFSLNCLLLVPCLSVSSIFFLFFISLGLFLSSPNDGRSVRSCPAKWLRSGRAVKPSRRERHRCCDTGTIVLRDRRAERHSRRHFEPDGGLERERRRPTRPFRASRS